MFFINTIKMILGNLNNWFELISKPLTKNRLILCKLLSLILCLISNFEIKGSSKSTQHNKLTL